jgi:hypothetical protein
MLTENQIKRHRVFRRSTFPSNVSAEIGRKIPLSMSIIAIRSPIDDLKFKTLYPASRNLSIRHFGGAIQLIIL